MNKLLALVIAAFTLGMFTPTTAEAGSRYGSSYRSGYRCGSPVYKVRYYGGYSRGCRTAYRYRYSGHSCRPRPYYGRGYRY